MKKQLPSVRLSDERGFTLVELLVATAILPIVLMALVLMLTTTIHFSDEAASENTLQTQTRAAIDRLTQDIRAAYYGGGTAPIEAMTATTVTFDSPDRSTPFHLRRISYRLQAGVLQRAYATSSNTDGPPWTFPPLGPWSTEVTNVTSTTPFTYLDSNGVATTNPAAVTRFGVSIAVATINKKQLTYAATVELRNAQ